MSLSLGIDVGTSGVRTAVLTAQGDVLPMARTDHVAQNKDYIDADGWWRAVQTCILRQIEILWAEGFSPLDITGIAVDGTSGTMVLTDINLRPVTRAMMYNSSGFDTEAAMIARFAPDLHITRGSASALARAMRLAAEDVDHAACHLLHQADFIAAKLMGQGGLSDHNNALKTGFDPETEMWPDWIEACKLNPSLLPEVRPVGAQLAAINPQVATELGLSRSVTIHAGTTDSIAAFLACAPLQEGAAVTSLGTTLAVKLLSPNRIDDPEIGLYSHRLGTVWLVGGASNTGGGVLLDHFSTDQISTLCKRIDPTKPTGLGFYPLSKPGERFPIKDPDFVGRLSPRPKDDVIFLQAMLEGIAAVEARCYREIEVRGGGAPHQLFTAGGGAQNAVWTALREIELGMDITAATRSEAAIGCAKLAQI